MKIDKNRAVFWPTLYISFKYNAGFTQQTQARLSAKAQAADA